MIDRNDRGPQGFLHTGYDRHHAGNRHNLESSPGAGEPDPQGARVNYPIDDICIVISTSDPDRLEEHYRAVLQDLNNRFDRANFIFERKAPIGPADTPGADPRVFVGQHDSSGRQSAKGAGNEILPFVLLPPVGDNDVAHGLLFFHVRGRPTEHQPASPDPVIDAFHAINGGIDQGNILMPDRPYAILAPSPNWFHPAADDHSQGCPASRPERAPQEGWHFDLPEELEPPEDAADVLVVVLDTCPEADVVREAAERFEDNNLLQEVWRGPNSVNLTSDLSLTRTQTTYVAPPPDGLPSMESWHLESHPGINSNWHDFRMDDHGLFVAGIVRDIACKATVEVIRVLGDFGVGPTQGITSVLSKLAQRLDENKNLRLIVNLSLVASIPPNQWELPRVYAAMGIAIKKLVDKGALVIASAGNEDEGTLYPNLPVPPMYPARLPYVLSVSAINRCNQKAWYADRASLLGFSNGVAVFGGDILPSADGHHHPFIDMDPEDGRVDSVAGLFRAPGTLPLNVEVNPTLPLNADRTNNTGWAYWSGSSFATPVISAIAANIWAGQPGWTAAQVKDRIQAVAATDPLPAFRAFDGAGRIFVEQTP
jgi:hypothetical protein